MTETIQKSVDGVLVDLTPEEMEAYNARLEAAANRPVELVPLLPYQYHAMMDFKGHTPNIEAAIENIEDPLERSIVRNKLQFSERFQRYDPNTVKLSLALGITPEELDEMWALAQSL